MSRPALGPWATDTVNQRYGELAARSADLAPGDRLRHIGALVVEQARWVDRECLNLNAATNVMNPYANQLVASGIGSQELARWGMGPAEMPEVARLIARVLLHDEPASSLRDEVIALRGRFQQIHYTLSVEET